MLKHGTGENVVNGSEIQQPGDIKQPELFFHKDLSCPGMLWLIFQQGR